jgi:hypothetical protein
MSIITSEGQIVCINYYHAKEHKDSDWMVNWVTPSSWLYSWSEYNEINLKKVRTSLDILKGI